MKIRKLSHILTILVTFTTIIPSIANAHFPWLMVNDDGKPALFFGEDLSDRTYHLPKNLASFPLKQIGDSNETHDLKMDLVESETHVGLVATDSVAANGCIVGTQTYGNYHGTKLVYFVQHCLGSDPQHWQLPPSDDALQANIEPYENGVKVLVTWNKKPLAESEVKLSSEDGNEQGSAKTDGKGVVTFTGKQLRIGLNAIMVGFTDKEASGTFNDEAFASTSNYLTATFNWKFDTTSTADAAKVNAKSEVQIVASEFPELPTELTSFGGAIAGGKLYVYGGHIGGAHSYSTAEHELEFVQVNN